MPNKFWCTDFTYLFLTNGRKRCNCSIIDLYDRSIVASITGKEITSVLAVQTFKKALDSQANLGHQVILHSDHGSQYTSKEYINYCREVSIIQSMSKARCPFDNATMKRYIIIIKK